MEGKARRQFSVNMPDAEMLIRQPGGPVSEAMGYTDPERGREVRAADFSLPSWRVDGWAQPRQWVRVLREAWPGGWIHGDSAHLCIKTEKEREHQQKRPRRRGERGRGKANTVAPGARVPKVFRGAGLTDCSAPRKWVR